MNKSKLIILILSEHFLLSSEIPSDNIDKVQSVCSASFYLFRNNYNWKRLWSWERSNAGGYTVQMSLHPPYVITQCPKQPLLPALSAVPAHRRRWRIVCLVIKEVRLEWEGSNVQGWGCRKSPTVEPRSWGVYWGRGGALERVIRVRGHPAASSRKLKGLRRNIPCTQGAASVLIHSLTHSLIHLANK